MQKIINYFKRLFSASKKKKIKGFSLIELLVVVGIMGILAAVAIPAYNNYRRTAKTGVINATLTQIEKVFPACLSVTPFMGCNTPTINGTLRPQSGSAIDGMGDDQRYCYHVSLVGDDEGYNGCVDFVNDNTGARMERVLGRPIGSPCDDPAISLSCSAMNATPTHDCPTAKGCVYTVGSADCGDTSSPWLRMGGTAMCEGVTTDSTDTECTTAGLCKRQ